MSVENLLLRCEIGTSVVLSSMPSSDLASIYTPLYLVLTTNCNDLILTYIK